MKTFEELIIQGDWEAAVLCEDFCNQEAPTLNLIANNRIEAVKERGTP